MSLSNTAAKKPKRTTMGKPKPLALSSFILLSPDSMMKIDGLSMRGAWVQMNRETVFKGIERFLKIRPSKIPPKLAVHMKDLFDELPDSDIKTLFIKGLSGDAESTEKIDRFGLWETFQFFFPNSSQDGTHVWLNHFVEVEQASVEIDALLREGAYAAAAESLKTNTTLLPYVSANALESLTQARTDAQTLLPRSAGLCEFLLAQVARQDVLFGVVDLQQKCNPIYQYLLSAKAQQTCSPGRELYQWLKVTLSIKTFSEFQRLAARSNGSATIDISSLKRWSQGTEFPQVEKLRLVLETIMKNRGFSLDDTTVQQIDPHYWAARRLHKLLEFVRQFLWAEQSVPGGAGAWSSLLGYSSADQWAQERYTFWLSHWQSLNLASTTNP